MKKEEFSKAQELIESINFRKSLLKSIDTIRAANSLHRPIYLTSPNTSACISDVCGIEVISFILDTVESNAKARLYEDEQEFEAI